MATAGVTPLTSEVPCVYVGPFRLSRQHSQLSSTTSCTLQCPPDGSAGFGQTRERSFDCQNWRKIFSCVYCVIVSRDCSVGIETRYGLHGPGIESPWRRDFPHPSKTPLGPTQPPIQWTPGLSQGYSGRSVALTTHLHLESRLKKE